MLRLITSFWEQTVLTCQANGNHGQPFKVGQGVTQGGPLLTKLFNILIDAVVWECLRHVVDKDVSRRGITKDATEWDQ